MIYQLMVIGYHVLTHKRTAERREILNHEQLVATTHQAAYDIDYSIKLGENIPQRSSDDKQPSYFLLLASALLRFSAPELRSGQTEKI